jgi:hypothetical protein
MVAASLAACSETGNGSIDEAVTEEVARQTGASPSTDTSPCEILDDELIGRHFDIAGVEIERSPSRYSRHPLCTASWPKPNAAEIEERRAEQMADYTTRKMRGEDVEMPSFRTTNEVSLTISEDAFESQEQARAAFDSAMRVMSEGMSVGTEAGSVETPRYELEPVEGVGEKAMWAPELRQLSVVTTDRIFHVGVQTDGDLDEELLKAKEIAREIAEVL